MQGVAILGATGSIGRSTLDVVRRHPERLQVVALTAARDVAAMLTLVAEFRPRLAVMADPEAAARLRRGLREQGISCEVGEGAAGLVAAATHAQAHQIMSAIVGAAGLMPTLAAVQAGKRVLIANKEPLVMAGRLVMAEAERSGATLVPIDSEHNAIFQCLPESMAREVRSAGRNTSIARLILTGSGGPFRETPLEDLPRVTPEQAVRHPKWSMGPKISVDSATMMNKGLELIEARWLFAMPAERIDIVLHPESVVHSLVEFVDGSTLAQLGQPDMRVPIAHALAWPERWSSGVGGLDFARLGALHFSTPDPRRYPCLELARAALRAEGAMPNVLNAANEEAVSAFLQRRIAFPDIARIIGTALDAAAGSNLPQGSSLDEILAVESWARAQAAGSISASRRAIHHA